eukprot:9821351-Heterocapsa_arctica.AAC.2
MEIGVYLTPSGVIVVDLGNDEGQDHLKHQCSGCISPVAFIGFLALQKVGVIDSGVIVPFKVQR